MTKHRWKLLASAVMSILSLSTAVGAFWYQDWQYSLPAPRPDGLEQPELGSVVDVTAITGRATDGRPLAIHVVNPDCPCSRFNRDHLRTLVKRFGDRMEFVALVQGIEDAASLEDAFMRWGVSMRVVADPGGRRAALLGAYSTPQAVIVTREGRLYFRGNYNRTRYCVDPQSEYVRLAIDALLAGAPLPDMRSDAFVAYGCPFPRRADSELSGE